MNFCPSPTLTIHTAFPSERNGNWEELSMLVTPGKVEALDTPKEKLNKLKDDDTTWQWFSGMVSLKSFVWHCYYMYGQSQKCQLQKCSCRALKDCQWHILMNEPNFFLISFSGPNVESRTVVSCYFVFLSLEVNLSKQPSLNWYQSVTS